MRPPHLSGQPQAENPVSGAQEARRFCDLRFVFTFEIINLFSEADRIGPFGRMIS
jgi:hypothetical protein